MVFARRPASLFGKIDDANFAIHYSIWNMERLDVIYANKHFLDFYKITKEEFPIWSRTAIESNLNNEENYNRFMDLINKMKKSRTAKTIITELKGVAAGHWRLIHMCPIGGGEHCLVISTEVENLHRIRKAVEHQEELGEFQKKYFSAYCELSLREKEVLKLTLEGGSNKEVGEQLFIATDTVKQHLKRIRRKTGLQSLADLMRFAQAFEII